MIPIRMRWPLLVLTSSAAILVQAAPQTSGDAAAQPNPAVLPDAVSADAAANMTTATAALLNANGCLGCHGIDQKIVGPSYHEVALKYRGQPDAANKLAESIRKGGAGKWGQMPMPPFTQLSSEELRSLAEFVLAK